MDLKTVFPVIQYIPFRQMDNWFQDLGNKVGLPELDQIKVAVTLFGQIPISFLFLFIQKVWLRHLIGIILGFILQVILYDDGIFYIYFQIGVTYYLNYFFKEKAAKIVAVESLLFLSYLNLYRLIYGSWKIDVSVVMMMQVIKYTSFSFCYADGFKKEDKLSSDQNYRKITNLPSFYEYFSYCVFFPSALFGPGFDYADYNHFMHHTDKYAKLPPFLVIFKESMKNLLQGLFFMCLIVVFTPVYPNTVVLSKEFKNKKIFEQITFLFFSSCMIRYRYFGGFLVNQASTIACGLSFNGYDKENQQPKWNEITFMDPTIEFEMNGRKKLDKWNISVNLWLKRYVYFRICNKDDQINNKSKVFLAKSTVNFVAAIWHGFYPAYWVFFLYVGLIREITECFERMSRNFPVFNHIGFRLVGQVLSISMIAYLQQLFKGLGLQNLIQLAKNTNFIFEITLISLLVFFKISRFGQKSTRKQQQNIEKQQEQNNNNNNGKAKKH